MKSICYIVPVVLFFLLAMSAAAGPLPVPVSAAESAATANDTGPEAWFNPSFPPMEFADENGAFAGMGADVLALVEQHLGRSFPRRMCEDWNRHLAGLRSGDCAIAPTIVWTYEREEYAFFTTPYASVPVVIIGTAAAGEGLTLGDLAGKRVAVVSGYATEGFLRERAAERLEIVPVPDVEAGLRETAFGQTDAFVANLAVASHFISRNGITNLKVVGQLDYEFDFRIAVSRHYPELYESIQAALSEIGQDRLSLVRDRWIALRPQSGLPARLKRNLTVGAIAVLAVVLGFLAVTAILRRELRRRRTQLDTATVELERSESRFRSLFLHAPAPMLEMTPEGRFLAFNEAAVRTFGYEIEDVPDLETWWQRTCPSPELRARARANWKEKSAAAAAGDHRIGPGEARIRCRDGSEKNCLVEATYSPDRIVVSLVEIDELKRMEAELKESRDRFSTLFDLAPFSCVISTLDSEFILANQHFCRNNGLDPDGIIGRSMEELGRFSDPEEQARAREELAKHGRIELREIHVQTPAGPRDILYSALMIEWHGQPAVLSATVDITDRKQAEQEIRRQEENLRVTLESIGDAVIATDTESRITRMNRVAEDLTGWPLDEARGRPLHEVFRIIDSQTREAAVDPVATVLSTGDIVELSNHTSLIARGGKEISISDSGAPIRADDGEITGVVLVFRDVTERYKIQEQLRHTQKMQAVGQLASGVAHDFNNMLGAMMGAAELLQESPSIGGEDREHLDMIVQAAQRAAELTGSLLAFSRRRPVEMRSIDLHAPIRDAFALLRRTLDPRIRLELKPAAGPIGILGNAGGLQNAFMNLLINASHAMPSGGAITVTTREMTLEPGAPELARFELEPGGFAEVVVSDTGTGIPPEILDRIFEPFFSTKGPGAGTGLGLAAVYGTLEQHHGAISVRSEIGAGTSFRLLLPLAKQAEPDRAAGEAPIEKRCGRILVVDDEQMVRSVTGRLLENLGFEAVLANGCDEARSLFGEAPNGFDLVIMDLSMPGTSGLDCAVELKNRKPEIQVVLASGHAESFDLDRARRHGLIHVLQKPFTSETLARAVAEATQADKPS